MSIRIERTIEYCSECGYCKEFVEQNGNTDYVLICTQNKEDSSSGFMIDRHHSKIKGYGNVPIPDNCPLPKLSAVLNKEYELNQKKG